MDPRNIIKQIKQLTVDVIEAGICDAQNFPSLTQSPGGISEIGISSVDNSIFLKNIPYSEMYSELIKKKTLQFQNDRWSFN